MVDFSLNPAYNARAAAGQVQTPGLVDWSGLGQRLYDDLQAPYWRRQDREQGAAVADPMQLRYTAQPRFVAQMVPRPPTVQPTQAQMQAMRNIPGSIPASTYTPSIRTAQGTPQRLPTEMGYGPASASNPAVQAIDAAAPTGPMFPLQMMGKGTNPAAAYAKGYTANMRFASPNAGKTGDGIIDLTASNPSERGAQGIADSQGAPVRVGSKVYYPAGKAPAATRQSAPQSQGQATSGGWFSSLFGGGGNSNGGGLLRNMLQNTASAMSGPSSIGSSPSQGQAMVVAPGTSSGSTLSSMGFSDGALVPAATIRGLESRGYFR
jgi:hypothetical protein